MEPFEENETTSGAQPPRMPNAGDEAHTSAYANAPFPNLPEDSPFSDAPYVRRAVPQPGQTPPPRPAGTPSGRKKGRGGTVAVSVLLAALMVVLGCCVTAFGVSSYWRVKTDSMARSMQDRMNVLQDRLNALENGAGSGETPEGDGLLTPGQIYAQNVEAVVGIVNQGTENIFGEETAVASTGSGFFLTEDGYVVTNYHVIENADRLTVQTANGEEYIASVIGSDQANDIALIKIAATGMPCVKLGSSDALAVGDRVTAIGNPLGELTATLTVGYVSAKDRLVTTDGVTMNMLQTDAAINPGNSGGPLFNAKGEVVGITTAKYSGTTSSGATIEGIGFAIPMDDVADMLQDLRQFGYITGAYLGVMVRTMDQEVSQTYGLPMGAYVESVTPGSCAEAAGIRAKDIITNLGGYDIENLTDLTRALRHFAGGDTTSVEVCRGGRTEYLTITLDEKPH